MFDSDSGRGSKHGSEAPLLGWTLRGDRMHLSGTTIELLTILMQFFGLDTFPAVESTNIDECAVVLWTVILSGLVSHFRLER